MSEITFAKTEERYELLIDDVVAVFADYFVESNTVELPHTVTEPHFRGQGLAGKLVAHVLDELVAAEMSVLPSCPYVASFIETHPQYQQLLQ
jgi:uncharacterized protein